MYIKITWRLKIKILQIYYLTVYTDVRNYVFEKNKPTFNIIFYYIS